MKLSDYARQLGVSYRTAWRMWKRGELNAEQLPSGTVIVKLDKPVNKGDLQISDKLGQSQKPRAIVQTNNLNTDCPNLSRFIPRVVIYARVSSRENKSNLETQAQRLEQYAIAKGYQIVRIVSEVGSGVNDNRKKLIQELGKDDYSLILCEHKDRLTRVGFNYIKVLLNQLGRDVEVVNLATERTDDLMQDFVSIITSFCARLYSIRRRTRKTECLINCLKDETNTETSN